MDTTPKGPFYGRFSTVTKARKEAESNRRANNGNNPKGQSTEFAYSPSTGAIGMRWEDGDTLFRVCNVHYPMYRRHTEVMDWVSVGVSRAAS